MDDRMREWLVRVEERRNALTQSGLAGAAEKMDAELQRMLEETMKRRIQSGTASDYVLRMLPERGFTLPDGQPDCVRFYHYACINPDVWSTFLSGTHAPSSATLMKLVVALALDEEQARQFLALSGAGFNMKDPCHCVLLACIECGYRDPESVCEILEYYEDVYARKSKPFKNIYRERTRKKPAEP